MLGRLVKFFYWLTAIVAVLVVSMVTLLIEFDWNRVRDTINHQVSTSLGREFAVQGNLNLKMVSGSGSESGWIHYLPSLPLLQITADEVKLSNPAWTHAGTDMAHAHRVVLRLRPFALLRKQLILTELELDIPEVALERRADGSTSWSMPDHGQSSWNVKIQRLALIGGTMHFVDGENKLDLQVQETPKAADPAVQHSGNDLQTEQQLDIQFVLGGTYAHAPVAGKGKIGSILMLEDESTVFPVQVNAQLGTVEIALNGTIADPRSPSGVDIDLSLASDSLADLLPLTGVLLPETLPFKVRGRLLGQKEAAAWNWTYQNFVGTVGSSDLAGTLTYFSHTPRPILRGVVTSNQLRLEDLGPLIGVGGKEQNLGRGKVANQSHDKALPTQPFHTEQWGGLDADVKLTGKHFLRTHDIALDNLIATIHLTDRVISITPLYFGVAGGDVTSNIVLDGRSPNIEAQIKLAARNVQLRKLFPALQSMRASLGEISGDAALTGHGNSVATMLGTSNGEFVATVNQGSISRYILEEAGLNLANVLYVKMFGDKQIQLNCLISDFAVKDGIARARHFVIDTDDATINITGDVDMSRETLNLDLRPNAKSLRIFSLRTPLYAKGTFEHPDVGPYKVPMATRVAAAIALGVLAPPATALATINFGTAPVIDCPVELRQALRERSAPNSQSTAMPAEQVSKEEIQQIRKEK